MTYQIPMVKAGNTLKGIKGIMVSGAVPASASKRTGRFAG